MQQTTDEQVRALSACVGKTGEQITGLVPIQQAVDKKIAGLAEEEERYRRFLQSKLERIVPAPDETRGPQ